MFLTASQEAISGLVHNLRSRGYIVIGPSLLEGVVRLVEITEPEDLASGILDVQAPGRYSIGDKDPFIFSSLGGPDSPKRYLHPAELEVTRLIDNPKGIESKSAFSSKEKYAFLGIRPCDLRGVEVMDRAMMAPGFEDPIYSSLRKDSLFIVVNCTRAGENCFCATMGTGPAADSGYDVAITELPEKLLLDVPEGSMALFQDIQLNPASEEDLRVGKEMIGRARDQMGQRFEREDPSRLLYAGMDSPVWKETAERCLACGNCTMVCPTCFCNVMQDRADFTDGSVSRVRIWDSCLSKEFTYSAGGNPRQQRSARYRQFVMHKFAYWPEQFGRYGCVGCGRCITWCPVGIDITETVNGVLKTQPTTSEGQRGTLVV